MIAIVTSVSSMQKFTMLFLRIERGKFTSVVSETQ